MPVTQVVTLSDVHDHLNIPDSDTSHDTELQGFIDAATALVTYATGPIIPASFTETYETVGADAILLRNTPVLSVETVTEYIGIMAYTLTSQPPGRTVDNYGYSLDIPNGGLLVRRSAVGTRMNFLGSPVVVSYTAGRDSVPADIRMATLEDLRLLYQLTQQGNRPPFGSGDAAADSWSVGPLNLFPRLAALLDASEHPQALA